jgi:hypothetical protein
MKYTTIFLMALLINLITLKAEQLVDINGSFEKCRANTKGFVSPEGWVKSKISKGVKFSATTEEVKSGKFSLYIEADEKAQAIIYFYNAFIKAKVNQTITFTVYGKGEGNFRVGAIAYSDEAKSRAIRTLAAKAKKISDDENWQKFTFTIPINKYKRNGKEYTTFRLRPVIIVKDSGEFVLDDLTYELKESKK